MIVQAKDDFFIQLIYVSTSDDETLMELLYFSQICMEVSKMSLTCFQ